VGPRAGLDGRKISSTPGFDPGPSSSFAIPTELPGPHMKHCIVLHYILCFRVLELLNFFRTGI